MPPIDTRSDLEKAETTPFNRARRRQIAKNAGLPFGMANARMLKRAPIYLGIREFKISAGKKKKLVAEYKANAWRSLRELADRRAAEAAKAAKVSKGKTLSKKAMEKLEGVKSERNDRRGRTADR